MTIDDYLRLARRQLEESGIASGEAAISAEVLAREALGWERSRLFSALSDDPPNGFDATFAQLILRRAAGEPTAYIVGRREFWGLDFEVTPDVLVPRPDTELVVEETMKIFGGRTGDSIVAADVGTGSGCLAVVLARLLPRSRFVATDVSLAALKVAARNARRHGVSVRVDLVLADLLHGIGGPLDLVVSNPPYVPRVRMEGLQREIRNHEPQKALDGGPDGLDLVRRLLPEAASRLRPGGWLVFEFGYGQEQDVMTLVAGTGGLEVHHVAVDLQGIPRTAIVLRS
ncbi:MAG: peptide chain release factor N(5)-glutamine methyltransferase [Vicinamibacterales bacterium]